MSKRGAIGQGSKEAGLDDGRDDSVQVEQASSDVMSRRRIGVPKSRRRPGATAPGMGPDSLGHIFGQSPSSNPPSKSTFQSNPFNSIFSSSTQQQPKATTNLFGNLASGSHSSTTNGLSFPPASNSNSTSSNLFGGTIAPGGSSSFTFGAGNNTSNPFSQAQSGSSNLFTNSTITTPFKGFPSGPQASTQQAGAGSASNIFAAASAPLQQAGETSPGDSAMVSPPQPAQQPPSASQPEPTSPTPNPARTPIGNLFGGSSNSGASKPLFASTPGTSSILFGGSSAPSPSLFASGAPSTPSVPAATPKIFGETPTPSPGEMKNSEKSKPFGGFAANSVGASARETSTSSQPANLFGADGVPANDSSKSSVASQTPSVIASPFGAALAASKANSKPLSDTITQAPSTSASNFQTGAFAFTSGKLSSASDPSSDPLAKPATARSASLFGTASASAVTPSSQNDPATFSTQQSHTSSSLDSMEVVFNRTIAQRQLSPIQQAELEKLMLRRSLDVYFQHLMQSPMEPTALHSLCQNYEKLCAEIEAGLIKINEKRQANDDLELPPKKASKISAAQPPIAHNMSSTPLDQKSQSQTASLFANIVKDSSSPVAKPGSSTTELFSATPAATSNGGLFTPQQSRGGSSSRTLFGSAPQTAPPKAAGGLFEQETSSESGLTGRASQSSSGNSGISTISGLFGKAHSSSQSLSSSKPPAINASNLFSGSQSTSAGSATVPSSNGFSSSTANPAIGKGFTPVLDQDSTHPATDFMKQFGLKAQADGQTFPTPAKDKAPQGDQDHQEHSGSDEQSQQTEIKRLGSQSAHSAFIADQPGSQSRTAPAGIKNPFASLKQTADESDNSNSGSDDEGLLEEKESVNMNTSAGTGRSLFERVARDTPTADKEREGKNSVSPAALPTTASNIFGTSSGANGRSLFSHTDKTPESKTSGVNVSSGDHTWKGDSDSPLKFNQPDAKASSSAVVETPKPSSSLFGMASQPQRPFAGFTSASTTNNTAASLFGELSPKPTPSDAASTKSADQPGFLFGPKVGTPTPTPSAGLSLFSNSRATTPGAMSNGTSAQASDDEGAPPEDQSDLTALTAEERGAEAVLFDAKAKLLQLNKDDKQNPFSTLGTGPLRVLKNKETGGVRLMLRCAPRGRVILNASLQAGMSYSKKQKSHVQLVAPDMSGQLRSFFVKVGQDERANELLSVLEANTPAG